MRNHFDFSDQNWEFLSKKLKTAQNMSTFNTEYDVLIFFYMWNGCRIIHDLQWLRSICIEYSCLSFCLTGHFLCLPEIRLSPRKVPEEATWNQWVGFYRVNASLTVVRVTTLQTMWNSPTIPWHFRDTPAHIKCYSYHASTSVIVSGGGRNATVQYPKPKGNAQMQQSQEWMQICS